MSSVKTLPLLSEAKLIILDEDIEAMYARTLIAGWLKMWEDTDPTRTFHLLSFSDPKSWYEHEPEPFASCRLTIHDYYTIDTRRIHGSDFDTLRRILKTFQTESTVIVDCLSSLILLVGFKKALWFLERLAEQAPQIICIYRGDIVQNKIPCIETFGTTYVRINKYLGLQVDNNCTYTTKFVHHCGRTILARQMEKVIQDNVTYKITTERIKNRKKAEVVQDDRKQKIESSFRIEINEDEMKQREKVALPYTIKPETENTSKIHYYADNEDDMDEEDPDDDLHI